MKLHFDEKQLKLLKKLDIPFDIEQDLTDEQIVYIEEAVGDYLVRSCLDKNYNPTQEGMICESIIDYIAEK